MRCKEVPLASACDGELARRLAAVVPLSRRGLWHGFQQYWSLARVGRRFGPRLSLGLEGGALGNVEYAAGRGGGFVRADLRAVELTLSGGFTGNYLEDEPSGYVSLGVYRAF